MAKKTRKKKHYRNLCAYDWLTDSILSTYSKFCGTSLQTKYDKLLDRSNKFEDISDTLFYIFTPVFGITIFLPLLLLVFIPTSPLREWLMQNDAFPSAEEMNQALLIFIYAVSAGLGVLVGLSISYGASALCLWVIRSVFEIKEYNIVSTVVNWVNEHCDFQFKLVKWKDDRFILEFGFGESIYRFWEYTNNLWQELTTDFPAPIPYDTAMDILNPYIQSVEAELGNCNKMISLLYMSRQFNAARKKTKDFKSEIFNVEIFN